MSHFFLGFDPGGVEAFGWAVLQSDDHLPLVVRASGVASTGHDSLAAALSRVPTGVTPLAAGIDGPLFWSPYGDRVVDKLLRAAIAPRGARSPGGIVQHVNSLRGSCVVQAVVTAILTRRHFPALLITESHPKALLWLLDVASRRRTTAKVGASELASLIRFPGADSSEHERDAALGAYAAWAGWCQLRDWTDILRLEDHPLLPVDGPVAYWMPGDEGQWRELRKTDA